MDGRPQAERTGVSESNHVVISLVLQRGCLDFTRHDDASLPFRHDQIGFLVIPAITKSKVERRRVAVLKQLLKPGLVMLFEEIDGAEVRAEETQVPLVWIEVNQGNSGVVLHNSVAVRENEIADRAEAVFEH
jgi:hypothetical protein